MKLELEIDISQLASLEQTIQRSPSIDKYFKDWLLARIYETRRDWQIDESRKRIISMATELSIHSTNNDNMLSVSGIQDEIHSLAVELCGGFNQNQESNQVVGQNK